MVSRRCFWHKKTLGQTNSEYPRVLSTYEMQGESLVQVSFLCYDFSYLRKQASFLYIAFSVQHTKGRIPQRLVVEFVKVCLDKVKGVSASRREVNKLVQIIVVN